MNALRLCLRLLCATALMAPASCTSVPGDVIPPRDMAPLIADTHLAESIIDYVPSDFPTDSVRQALKHEVYSAHGFTDEQVDASLLWYGRHLNVYNEVYDEAIAILERRQEQLAAQTSSSAIVYVGDSVDIWSLPRHVQISPRSPAQGMRVDIPVDAEMQPGDVYTWRAKMLNTEPNVQLRWSMLAVYDDGTVETYSSSSNVGAWRQFEFGTDSTRQLRALRGAAMVEGPATVFALDSISLTRRRLNPATRAVHARNRIYIYRQPEQ